MLKEMLSKLADLTKPESRSNAPIELLVLLDMLERGEASVKNVGHDIREKLRKHVGAELPDELIGRLGLFDNQWLLATSPYRNNFALPLLYLSGPELDLGRPKLAQAAKTLVIEREMRDGRPQPWSIRVAGFDRSYDRPIGLTYDVPPGSIYGLDVPIILYYLSVGITDTEQGYFQRNKYRVMVPIPTPTPRKNPYDAAGLITAAMVNMSTKGTPTMALDLYDTKKDVRFSRCQIKDADGDPILSVHGNGEHVMVSLNLTPENHLSSYLLMAVPQSLTQVSRRGKSMAPHETSGITPGSYSSPLS